MRWWPLIATEDRGGSRGAEPRHRATPNPGERSSYAASDRRSSPRAAALSDPLRSPTNRQPRFPSPCVQLKQLNNAGARFSLLALSRPSRNPQPPSCGTASSMQHCDAHHSYSYCGYISGIFCFSSAPPAARLP